MGNFGGFSVSPNHSPAHFLDRIVKDLIIKYQMLAAAYATVTEMAAVFKNRKYSEQCLD